MCHGFSLFYKSWAFSIVSSSRANTWYFHLRYLIQGKRSFDSSSLGLLRKGTRNQTRAARGQREAAREELKQHTGFPRRHRMHMILTHSHKNEGLFSRSSSSTLKSPEGRVLPGKKATLASTALNFPRFGHSHAAFTVTYSILFLSATQSPPSKPFHHCMLHKKWVLFLEQKFISKYTKNRVVLVLNNLVCG